MLSGSMVRILFFMALLLAAAPVRAQGNLSTEHTGLSGGYSAELQVSRHRHFSIYAQGTVVRHGNAVAHAVFLRHGLNDGSIIYIDEAWSFGRRLHFDDVPPDRTCGGTRCLYNIGVLTFTRSEFARLAQSGLELRLIGSEGPIDIRIPARIFAEAQTQSANVIR